MKVKNLKIRLNRVMSVYSGRPGCMCGCVGTYRVASEHLAVANVDRGYDYDREDVNDRQVRKVVRILEAQTEVEMTSHYVFAKVQTGGGPSGYRYYAAYFVPSQAELDAKVARRAEGRVKAAIAAENKAFFTKLGF